MANWYTSDTHFGDEGILTILNRPFVSSSAMDAAMIQSIQSFVRPDDDLWIVGDFAMIECDSHIDHVAQVFNSLTCRKHLVRGNHDSDRLLLLNWVSVHDLVEVQDGAQRFVLCHYPLLTWNYALDGAVQLFGHVHKKWLGSSRSVNVGTDVWNFAPACAYDILDRAARLHEHRPGWETSNRSGQSQ